MNVVPPHQAIIPSARIKRQDVSPQCIQHTEFFYAMVFAVDSRNRESPYLLPPARGFSHLKIPSPLS
jgi:hypothetical protein